MGQTRVGLAFVELGAGELAAVACNAEVRVADEDALGGLKHEVGTHAARGARLVHHADRSHDGRSLKKAAAREVLRQAELGQEILKLHGVSPDCCFTKKRSGCSGARGRTGGALSGSRSLSEITNKSRSPHRDEKSAFLGVSLVLLTVRIMRLLSLYSIVNKATFDTSHPKVVILTHPFSWSYT